MCYIVRNYIFIFIIVLFIFIQINNVFPIKYYVSPDSNLEEPNQCTDISQKCSLKSIFLFSGKDIEIYLTKSNFGTKYNAVTTVRTSETDRMILHSEEGVAFERNFYLAINTNITYFEMNDFYFQEGTEIHPSPTNPTQNVSYILHIESTNNWNSIIHINNFKLKSDLSSSLFSIQNKNATLTFNRLNLTYSTTNSMENHVLFLPDDISYFRAKQIFILDSEIKNLSIPVISSKSYIDTFIIERSNLQLIKPFLNDKLVTMEDEDINFIVRDSIIRSSSTFFSNTFKYPNVLIDNSTFLDSNSSTLFFTDRTIDIQIVILNSEFINTKILYANKFRALNNIININISNTNVISNGETIFLKFDGISNLNIENCTFENTDITIENSEIKFLFRNNSVYNGEKNIIRIESTKGYASFLSSHFKNLEKGLHVSIDESLNDKGILIQDCSFRNISNYNDFNEENLIGNAIYASSSLIEIRNNKFNDCHFIKKTNIQVIGVVGIMISKNLIIENNEFINLISDLGAVSLVFSNIAQNNGAISIYNNTFINTMANKGSALAVVTAGVSKNIVISHNIFEGCISKLSIIHFQTLLEATDISILRNSFRNSISDNNNTGISSIIEFESGHVHNAYIKDNLFEFNDVLNEIRCTLIEFSGEISNNTIIFPTLQCPFNSKYNFDLITNTITNSINDKYSIYQSTNTNLMPFNQRYHLYLTVENIHNLVIKDQNIPNDAKGFLHIASGALCNNILLNNIYSQEYPCKYYDFLELLCSRINYIELNNIIYNNSFVVEQTSNINTGKILIKDSNFVITDKMTRTVSIKRINANIYNTNFYFQNTGLKNETLIKKPLLKLADSNVFISNVTLENGINDSGGCLNSKRGFIELENSKFKNCESKNGVGGGAIFAEEGQYFKMKNTIFDNCNSDNNGGSILLQSFKNILIIESNLTISNALEGGCIYISNFDSLNILDTKFDECIAEKYGGGLFLNEVNSSKTVDIQNTDFISNKALISGGGIWVEANYSILLESFKYNNNKFINCNGGFVNDLGTYAIKLNINNITKNFISYNFLKLFEVNPFEIIFNIETPFGRIIPQSDKQINISNDLIEYKLCPDLIKRKYIDQLKDEEIFCYQVFLNSKFFFKNIKTELYISFENDFHLKKSSISSLYLVEFEGLLTIVLSVVGVGFVCINFILLFLILLIITVSLFIFVLYYKYKLTGVKMKYAELELKLLRNRMDQDTLIEGGIEGIDSNKLDHVFQLKMSDVTIIGRIGSGGSGAHVIRATWKDEDLALKLFRGGFVETMKEEFENEIHLLSTLYHPNIVKFCGVILDPPRYGFATEYCPGSVSKLIRSNKSKELNWSNKLTLLFQTVSAMEYLVKRDIIHRDLKWENVLMSKSGDIRLTDLGLSRRISEATPQNLTARVGTSYLMAPEVVKGLNYDWRCDVFSLGVMIYELLTDKLEPFEGIPSVEFKIASDPNYRPSLEILKPDLIEDVWSPDNTHSEENNFTLNETVSDQSNKLIEFDTINDNENYDILAEDTITSSPENSSSTKNNQNATQQIICKRLTKDQEWIIDIMSRCWDANPDNRPSFSELKDLFFTYINKTEKLKTITFQDDCIIIQ